MVAFPTPASQPPGRGDSLARQPLGPVCGRRFDPAPDRLGYCGPVFCTP